MSSVAGTRVPQVYLRVTGAAVPLVQLAVTPDDNLAAHDTGRSSQFRLTAPCHLGLGHSLQVLCEVSCDEGLELCGVGCFMRDYRSAQCPRIEAGVSDGERDGRKQTVAVPGDRDDARVVTSCHQSYC